MSISDFNSIISVVLALTTAVVLAMFVIFGRTLSRKFIISVLVILALLIVSYLGLLSYVSHTTVVSINGITKISSLFNPTPTDTPTATPSPTPPPSPTPTLITITRNLDIPYNLCCGIKIGLKLTTIVIDTSKQTSTWSFTLTNNGNYINSLHFTTLVLEDNTGQKHQGGGLALTDSWNMSSGQSIQTYATFDVVHGTNYLLNIAIEYGTYQTETITF